MKETTYYVCEICNTKYEKKEDAERCERSHAKIDQLSREQYLPNDKYPTSVEVKFCDGLSFYYYKH